MGCAAGIAQGLLQELDYSRLGRKGGYCSEDTFSTSLQPKRITQLIGLLPHAVKDHTVLLLPEKLARVPEDESKTEIPRPKRKFRPKRS